MKERATPFHHGHGDHKSLPQGGILHHLKQDSPHNLFRNGETCSASSSAPQRTVRLGLLHAVLWLWFVMDRRSSSAVGSLDGPFMQQKQQHQ